MKYKHGELTIKLLEAVKSGAELTVDIVTAFLESGYGASYGKLTRNLDKRVDEREALALERQKIYAAVARLKKSGYFEVVDQKWKITGSGLMKLDELKKIIRTRMTPQTYKNQESSIIKIVMFDIPEKLSFARRWLRNTLSNLGFIMMQKSVWIGKSKIPPEFLDDIKKLRLENFIEIITVNKSGNIRKLR